MRAGREHVRALRALVYLPNLLISTGDTDAARCCE